MISIVAKFLSPEITTLVVSSIKKSLFPSFMLISSITALVLIDDIQPAYAGITTRDDFDRLCRERGGFPTPVMAGTYCLKDNNGAVFDKNNQIQINGVTVFPRDRNEIDTNKDKHKDQGVEPFSGIFQSNVSLNPLPSSLTLSLNTSSSTSTIWGPIIWGEPLINTSISEATIGVSLNQTTGEFEVTNFIYKIDPFDINGVSSGQNFITPRPGIDGKFEFDSGTGKLDVRLEEILTNDLYPNTNPILIFSNAEGQIISDTEILFTTTSDLMIVPGVPNQPPIDAQGMAYIPTVAFYDANTNLLTFKDNLLLASNPDVSIVRTPGGTYLSTPGLTEPLVGATYQIQPLQFLGEDNNGCYRFSDSSFSIFNSDGVFIQGRLTNTGFCTDTFNFTSNAILEPLSNPLFSPFIERWIADPFPLLQLLSPEGTNALLGITGDFSVSGSSPIDAINLIPKTPESSNILGLFAIGVVGAASTLKRKLKPSKSTEKETTKVS